VGSEERRKKQYRELLRYSRQSLNDSKRLIEELEQIPPSGGEDCASLPKTYQQWPGG
jgi:hypothetical protein